MRQTDKQTNERTNEQMDTIDALSRSRYRDRRFNKLVTLKSRLEVNQGHSNGTIWYIAYEFLLASYNF